MSLAESASKIGHLNDEERRPLENCLEVTEVCDWCADECAESDRNTAAGD